MTSQEIPLATAWPVLENAASTSASLEPLDMDDMHSCTEVLLASSVPHSVAAVVVDDLLAVNPQLASIIGSQIEVIVLGLADNPSRSEANCEVVPSSRTRKIAAGRSIVDFVNRFDGIRTFGFEVGEASSLPKVVDRHAPLLLLERGCICCIQQSRLRHYYLHVVAVFT